METGTQILIERMKTHPEEFLEGRISKWGRIVAMTECLPEEDKQALKEAHNRAKIDYFNGEVLATLAGERELSTNTTQFETESRYATGFTNPLLKAEAQRVQKVLYHPAQWFR